MTTPTAAQPSSRRRGGRPLLPPDERRGHLVGFHVTPSELARLETAKAAAGARSVSDYVRDALFARPLAAPAHRARRRDLGPVVGQLARLGNNLNQILREARFGNFPPDVAAAALDALREAGAYLRRLAAADRDDPET